MRFKMIGDMIPVILKYMVKIESKSDFWQIFEARFQKQNKTKQPPPLKKTGQEHICNSC